MSDKPIGLQLFSVRNEAEKDLAGVLQAVKKMGYDGVEFAGYYGHSAEDVRKMLDDAGLVCCGTHIGIDKLLGDALEPTVEFHKTIGCEYLIVPWLGGDYADSRQAWKKTAGIMNGIAARLKPYGMFTGYHNHHTEFTPLDGELPWDTFFGNTDHDVIMQFDIGNALLGGGDAAPFLRAYPGRAVTVHVKEYSKTDPAALIGEGDVNWDEILTLCETTAGTKWYIIEHETANIPPMECVEVCLNLFKKLVAKY